MHVGSLDHTYINIIIIISKIHSKRGSYIFDSCFRTDIELYISDNLKKKVAAKLDFNELY